MASEKQILKDPGCFHAFLLFWYQIVFDKIPNFRVLAATPQGINAATEKLTIFHWLH